MQFTAFWRIFTGRAQAKAAPTGNLTFQTFQGSGESRNSGRLSSRSHSRRNCAHCSSRGITTQAAVLQKLGRLFTHPHGDRREQSAGGAAASPLCHAPAASSRRDSVSGTDARLPDQTPSTPGQGRLWGWGQVRTSALGLSDCHLVTEK